MLPSLSIEFRLPVGVDLCSDPFSSLANLAEAPWSDDCDPGGGPSRLCSPLSLSFFDLKRKAMARVKPQVGRPVQFVGRCSVQWFAM